MPRSPAYAASKAAVSALTECLAHQLTTEGTRLRAATLYPSGGLLATGLFTSCRNRPAELAREVPLDVPVPDFVTYRKSVEATGQTVKLQDLDELARLVLTGLRDGRFIIGYGMDDMGELLKVRADAIGRSELPPDIFAMQQD